MLKVVQPPTGGQGEGAPARRRKSQALRLTDAERMRLRAAVRHLRALYGSWGCLAEVMGVQEGTLKQLAYNGTGGSHSLAIRAAKAAGTTMERIIGAPMVADRCPHCGARPEAT